MATTEDILKRETRALVFDLYGTVVDMQSGLTTAVTPFLKKKGWEGNPSSFVTWWRRTHFEDSMIDALLDRGHTPYRQIGHRAVSQVMDRCGIAHTQDDVTWLVSQIELLKPFPDVIAALNQLKEMRHYSRTYVEQLTAQWLVFDGPLKKLKQAGKFEDLMTRQAEFHEALDGEIGELEELAVALQPAPEAPASAA